MWIQALRKALEIAAALFGDMEEDQKKKKLVEIGMDIWDYIDPTPDIELDDEIVRIILEHLADMAIEAVESLKN